MVNLRNQFQSTGWALFHSMHCRIDSGRMPDPHVRESRSDQGRLRGQDGACWWYLLPADIRAGSAASDPQSISRTRKVRATAR